MKTDTQRLAAKHSDSLDLGGLGDLASMLDSPVAATGSPTMFELHLIGEDPNNQRTANNPGFSDESIAELAATMMGGRGVKSPLSLRPNPQDPGRYIINHGHRRFRAAKVAGLTHVPAFIDAEFSQYDQMIENIQRENLTAREIADFIGGQIAAGKTMTEIAAELGKSKAFVSQHAALLSLPDPVAQAFHSGHVQDVTLVNELARAHKENPVEVEKALKDAQAAEGVAAAPLTRKAVKAIRKANVNTQPSQPQSEAAEKAPTEPIHDLKALEKALASDWGARVQVVESSLGQVTLVVHTENWERFGGLLQQLGQTELADNVFSG